jgi:mannose-6-phosphate isomerase-like protein (cupin superfamily)
MKLSSITEGETKGFVQDIEGLTETNKTFRKVLYTAKHSQLVLMSIKPGEDIGQETHENDQFFRVEEGNGEVVINGERTSLEPGSGIVIPAGCEHNITNTGEGPLQLYSLYAPPHHEDKVVHQTKQDAEADDEEFEGETTEQL